ncbi:MAG TPA: ABC transporter ATP-binding protein [Marmoricola sp.]|jgi:iron(III) transport system ATP-binding protein|nr:ABC transporter ATP-binding protein [Marmoricola sp.]
MTHSANLMPDAPAAVTITGLTKSYDGTLVLDGIDLVVPRGSITSVLGSSGCGKTTLLRIVAGFVRADAGSVALEGRVVEHDGKRVAPDKRGVGYVPQEGALFPHLDVAGNILFGLPRRQRTQTRLRQMLDLAELGQRLAHRYPHELSGGQQQRVAIARALAPAPAVVLLDEPFSSLDAALRVSAGREVSRVLRHAGATAILVTHDQGEALSLADQVALMRQGRFVQVDAPNRLYEAPADIAAAQFVGGASLLEGAARDGVAQTVLGAVEVSGVTDGPVRLLVRPEQLEVHSAPDDATGGPKATVDEVSYYGAHVVLRLRLSDGRVLTARGPSARPPLVGDVVAVLLRGPVLARPGDPS